MSDPLLAISLVLVLVTCVACASVGFNRPSWSRSFTTAARYRGALAAHILLFLLGMSIVYAVLRRGISAYGAWEGRADYTSKVALVWISLAITLCVRVVSSQPRRWLQQMAGIPGHATSRAALLADGGFAPPPEIAARAASTLVSRGIDLEGDWLPPARPAYALLFKATALFIQLREWETAPRFTAFAGEAKNEFDLLRSRFDRLSIGICRTLATIERVGEIKHRFVATDPTFSCHEVDGLVKKIVGDLLADICEDLNALYDDACLLAVRGALMTERTRKGRRALLARLGFLTQFPVHRASFGILVPTGVLLYLGMWLFFFILPTPTANIQTKALIAVISIIVFGSISVGVIPKMRWGFANTGLHDRTPYAFVIGAGLCAVLFAVLVHLITGALLLGGMDGAIRRLQGGAPWLLLAFGTGSAMAWLVQDNRWLRARSARMRRRRDAATLSVVWLLAVLVSEWLDLEINDHFIALLTLTKVAFGSTVLGAAIGYLIPQSIRINESYMTEGLPLIEPSAGTLLATPAIEA